MSTRGPLSELQAGLQVQLVDQLHAGRALIIAGITGSQWAAARWIALHPDLADEATAVPCCDSTAYRDPEDCTCWRPVYDLVQQPPRPPASAEEIRTQLHRCGDCAYRPDSPERARGEGDDLVEHASCRRAFWCHQGMRRVLRWEHPDGRTVEPDGDDYDPATLGGIAFQADGTVGILCAGWAGEMARVDREMADG